MKKAQKKNLWIFGLLILVPILNSCTSSPYTYPPTVEGMPGIYHRIERGQTLWRISKIYNINLDELVQINRIYDPSKIKTGQLVFIPRASKKSDNIRPSVNFSSSAKGEDFIWPVRGRIINKFGQTINNTINEGIDIEASYGSDVVASRTGIVSFYNPQLKGLGKTIIIDHGDNFLTVYSRNSNVLVEVGERVAQGKTIAKVGNSGRDRRSYLHFEIRKGHAPKNPNYYLP